VTVGRHPALLDRAAAILVVIDVQEAYRAALHEFDRMTAAVVRLVRGAALLGVPVLLTEQYPQGLGHTVAELAEHLPPATQRFDKMSLSCVGAPGFLDAVTALGRRQVVLAGLETHACVNQTAHDLLAAGQQVHLPRDATSARHAADVETAWEKMRAAGVLPATSESVLLELIGTAAAPEFKALQRLIR
jgi:nicotinamidase-related amidase